ncbi:MAG: ABC transporter ATP-binding protein [Spirochaetales bacterium]|nr:ABC transporter ATP-binding protein [Spirochaetales bacterium]
MKKDSVLKRLQGYMGNRKILLPLSLTSSALSAAMGIAPYIFIWLIARELLTHAGQIAGTSVLNYAWWAMGAAVLSVLLYFVALISSHLAAFRVENNIRREAMGKIVKMPLGFFDGNSSGRIRKIIDDDSGTTHSFLAHQLPDLSGSVILPLATIVLVFVFDWRLGLACLAPLVLAFGTMAFMMGVASRNFQKQYMDALEDMSSEAVEYVRGIPVVKVFQQTIFSFKRFHNSILRYKDLVKKYTDSWEGPFSFYAVIVQCFAFFLVPAAILLVARGGDYGTVLADMFLYILVTPVLSSTIMKSMHINQSLFQAGEAINRIESLTDVEPLPETSSPREITSGDIVFDNVLFQYPGAEKNAVDGISFTLPEGCLFALVGPSGGGKTTIARMIPRFWDVLEGSVSLGGADVRDISLENLMDHVSFVFQNTRLFKTTLRDNIIYGCPDATEEQIERALDLAQCTEILDRLPDGLDTLIGAEGTYLSGGEQQRIALARAFLKDAPVIVLDEATAFADPENEHLLQEALRELMKGKTVLMIAHRLTTIQDADRILVIDKGQIAEEGCHEELLNKGGIYHRMWNEYQEAVEWTIEREANYV